MTSEKINQPKKKKMMAPAPRPRIKVPKPEPFSIMAPPINETNSARVPTIGQRLGSGIKYALCDSDITIPHIYNCFIIKYALHQQHPEDRKSTRLNSSHGYISYA